MVLYKLNIRIDYIFVDSVWAIYTKNFIAIDSEQVVKITLILPAMKVSTNCFFVVVIVAVAHHLRLVRAACGSNGLDLSPLAGKEYSISLGGYNYNLNVCGVSEQKCPKDPDGIFSGMVVQTKPSGLKDMPCWVLGVFDKEASWTSLTGSQNGAQLTMNNGSPSDCPYGIPRTVQVNFVCAPRPEPANGRFTLRSKVCDYVVEFPTCHACEGGCIKITTSSFGATFLTIFAISLLVYVALGYAINIFVRKIPLSKAFPNKAFWSAFFADALGGVSFLFGVFSGGNSSGSSKFQASAGKDSENPYNTA